ncbi:MAG: DUF6514 family protein [Acetanaerobacterium sp.]
MQGTVYLDKLENGLAEDMRLTYEIIETPIDPAVAELWEGDLLTYGVSVTKLCKGNTENAMIRDISTDRSLVERLVAALRRGRVTPIAVPDVVDDFMALLFWD